MKLVCPCLNVRIEVCESPQDLMIDLKDVTLEEKMHPYFQNGIYPVTMDMGGVTEQQQLLMRSILLGKWNIRECLVCRIHTHATNTASGGLTVSTLLIYEQSKIKKLQAQESFSPIFQIVFPDHVSREPSFQPGEVLPTQDVIARVHRQAANILQKAEYKIESSIKSYTEQQRAVLATWKNRMQRDKHALLRLLGKVQHMRYQFRHQAAATSASMGAPTASFSPQKKPHHLVLTPSFIECLEPDVKARLAKLPGGLTPRVIDLTTALGKQVLAEMQKAYELPPEKESSAQLPLQDLGVFQMDDDPSIPHVESDEGMFRMDDFPMQHSVLPEKSDGETVEEQTSEEKEVRSEIMDLARSAPVDVPIRRGSKFHEQLEQLDLTEKAVPALNIADSIASLAKSVHMTSADVFGELPRPKQPRDKDLAQ